MLRNNAGLYLVMLIMMLTSCIKHFEPQIESRDAMKFVVSGQVNQGDTFQIINISTTSPVESPQYLPVLGCSVKIIDNNGTSYEAVDLMNGNYQVKIPESELIEGNSFKVDILTPDGVAIESDFDQLSDCPAIDSVYYIVQEVPGPNPEIPAKAVQFYLNFDGTDFTCRNYRIEAVETWEYHSAYPIEWFYNGKVHHVVPIDFSKMVCWKTALTKDVFTLTTRNLAQNKYVHFPLNLVDNYSSPRLEYGYSLLIKQYSLSEAAYAYWEKIRINSNQQGGLYEKQPQPVKGNLHNLTNPELEVLGFFGASSLKSKRIFVSNVPDFTIKYDPHCDVGTLLKNGFKQINPASYPAYLFGDNSGYEMVVIRSECVDCLLLGGKNVKPSFWPK